MRTYRPDYVICGISKYRYDELKAFCRQYADKKAEAEALLSVGSPKLTGMPNGSSTGDPVSRAAERRDRLLTDCELIESCAKEVDGGRFYSAIIQNVCLDTGYSFLYNALPTNNRTAFYDARRGFFVRLNEELEKRVSNRKRSNFEK